MDWENCFDSLQLNQKTIVDVEIQFKRFQERVAFVMDFDLHLADGRHFAQLQLSVKALLVNILQQPGPFSRCTSIAAPITTLDQEFARSYFESIPWLPARPIRGFSLTALVKFSIDNYRNTKIYCNQSFRSSIHRCEPYERRIPRFQN